jgi:hypothetical protein
VPNNSNFPAVHMHLTLTVAITCHLSRVQYCAGALLPSLFTRILLFPPPHISSFDLHICIVSYINTV